MANNHSLVLLATKSGHMCSRSITSGSISTGKTSDAGSLLDAHSIAAQQASRTSHAEDTSAPLQHHHHATDIRSANYPAAQRVLFYSHLGSVFSLSPHGVVQSMASSSNEYVHVLIACVSSPRRRIRLSCLHLLRSPFP
jgi:hypothetical protein